MYYLIIFLIHSECSEFNFKPAQTTPTSLLQPCCMMLETISGAE